MIAQPLLFVSVNLLCQRLRGEEFSAGYFRTITQRDCHREALSVAVVPSSNVIGSETGTYGVFPSTIVSTSRSRCLAHVRNISADIKTFKGFEPLPMSLTSLSKMVQCDSTLKSRNERTTFPPGFKTRFVSRKYTNDSSCKRCVKTEKKQTMSAC